jgi:hypothetical protein
VDRIGVDDGDDEYADDDDDDDEDADEDEVDDAERYISSAVSLQFPGSCTAAPRVFNIHIAV